MTVNNEILEKHGFKKVNNSTWRKGNITLQSGYTHEDNDIYERILNTEKAFRCCIRGRFYRWIKKETTLIKILNENIEENTSNS
jgi:hypothetical protein